MKLVSLKHSGCSERVLLVNTGWGTFHGCKLWALTKQSAALIKPYSKLMLTFICRQVPQIGCKVSFASHNEVKVQCHGRMMLLLIQHSKRVITVTGAKWGRWEQG